MLGAGVVAEVSEEISATPRALVERRKWWLLGLVMAAGVLAWCLSAMAHGWAVTMSQFSAARIALGATESMGTPSFVKTVGAVFSARVRSLAFGFSNGVSSIGAIVTPLFLPLMAVTLGWRETFVFVGALGLVWVLVWLVVSRGLSFADTASG